MRNNLLLRRVDAFSLKRLQHNQRSRPKNLAGIRSPVRVSPPSTVSTSPVTYAEASLAKNRIAWATVSGVPHRRNVTAALVSSLKFGIDADSCHISVSI